MSTSERPPRTAPMFEHIRYAAPHYWRSLQDWLGYESSGERERLAAALESGDDRDFYAAAFELFLTQFLAGQGWEFERHPTLAWTPKQPDYLVHHPGGDFLLEAAVVMESDAARVAGRVRDALREELDTVTGPFQAIMTVDGHVGGGYRLREVADWLRAQLAGLVLAEGESREVVYPGDGFTIRFWLTPDAAASDEPVVVMENLTGSVAADVTTHEAIRDSIDGKQSRYGKPPMPYVVALDVQTNFPVEAFSLKRALYGTPQWNFKDLPGQPMQFQGETHQRNGMFTAGDGQGRPIRTRVSAAAVYRRRHVGDGVTEHNLVLCHHPYAAHPLPADAFACVPQLLPATMTEAEVVMRWADEPEPPEWVRR